MTNIMNQQQLINRVKNWLRFIIIGENFCPFAKQPFAANTIQYRVFKANAEDENEQLLVSSVAAIIDCCEELDNSPEWETTLLIMASCWSSFDDFLMLIDTADQVLDELNYRGTYQLAHFHPDYQFSGTQESDAQNFTNRAPVPVIHILRESSISNGLKSINRPESIPERNVRHATKKGADYFMKKLQQL